MLESDDSITLLRWWGAREILDTSGIVCSVARHSNDTSVIPTDLHENEKGPNLGMLFVCFRYVFGIVLALFIRH